MSLMLSFQTIAGDHIDRTCEELQMVSDKLNVIATADFNGVKVHAMPGGSAKVLHANWLTEMNNGKDYKSAWSK